MATLKGATAVTNYDRLPTRRFNRRVVIVVDLKAKYELREGPDAASLLSREDVAVLYAGTNLDETDHITQSLERQGLLVPGQILVASPYRDGDYAALDEASHRFGMQKWAAVSTLCGYLGAQSVSVKVVEDTLHDARIDLKASAQKSGIGGAASLNRQRVEKFAGELKWDDIFAGGGLDLELAERYLQESGLEADPEVRSLVQARAHGGNRLARRNVTVDLSRESQRTIQSALEVKVPTVVKAETLLKVAKESQAHFKVGFEVVFAAD